MGSDDEVGVVILVTAGLVVLVSLGEPADWGPPPWGLSSPAAWACCPQTWWWFSQSLCWQNGPQYLATLHPLHVSVAFRPQFQQLYGKNNQYPHKNVDILTRGHADWHKHNKTLLKKTRKQSIISLPHLNHSDDLTWLRCLQWPVGVPLARLSPFCHAH